MILNNKKLNTIKEEISEYLEYDMILNMEQKEKLLLILNNEINLEKINNDWFLIIIHYFYSHVSDEGKIISLEHNASTNKDIKDNYDFYLDIRKIFLNEIFTNNEILISLDVDHTLSYKGVISPEKIDFLKSFKYKQNIILNTGKVYNSISDIYINSNMGNNYSITLNGAVVLKNDEIIYANNIGDISFEIISKLNDLNIDFVCYYNNSIKIIKDLDEKNIEILKKYNEWYIDYDEINYDNIVKFLLFINDNELDKENQIKSIVKIYPQLNCLRTAKHCYEIVSNKVNKGLGFKHVAKLKKNYYRASIGFGDSMNDLSMLDYVGLPFIVSNSSDDLKSYNFEILKGSRKDDIVRKIKNVYKIKDL